MLHNVAEWYLEACLDGFEEWCMIDEWQSPNIIYYFCIYDGVFEKWGSQHRVNADLIEWKDTIVLNQYKMI